MPEAQSGLQTSQAPTETSIQTHLHTVVAQILRPAALGLAVLYSIIAVSHVVFLPAATAPVMSSVAALTAGMFGVWAWRLRHGWLPVQHADTIAASFVIAAAINSLLHVVVQNDILQTTNVAFVVVAAGGLLLSTRWFAGITSAVIGLWVGLVLWLPASPYLPHFGFALLLATVLGALFHLTRLRVFTNIARLRQQEEQSKHTIEQSIIVAQHNAARFRALAEAAFEGVIIHHNFIILDVNAAVARMFQTTEAALIGQPVLQLIVPSEHERLTTLAQRGYEQTHETQACRPDGREFPIEINARSVTYEGRVVRVVAVRDISERKRIEADLRDARDAAEAANYAKSAFLANMSHELRTPLNSIMGFGELLREDLRDSGQHAHEADMQRILKASNHLLTLLNNLIRLSNAEVGQHDLTLTTKPLEHVVLPIVAAAQAAVLEHGNILIVEPPSFWGDIYSDVGKIQHIVQQLLDNAAKFTTNGTITLSVSRTNSANLEYVVFSVADTGVGLSPEQIAHIFQPFTQADVSTTRRYGGTGMGLALSVRFAAILGGSLVVQSTLGHGATFTLSIPAFFQPQPTSQ